MKKEDGKSPTDGQSDDFMTFLKRNREEVQQWPSWKAEAFKRGGTPDERPSEPEKKRKKD